MGEYYEEYKHKGYTIRLSNDEDPDDPRGWDNLGTMVIFHSRYNLGDINQHGWHGKGSHEHLFLEIDVFKEFLRDKKSDLLWALPIYMYDHSGITINTTGFSCPWDSGKVGYIFVTKQQVRDEWKVKRISAKLKELVRKNLLGEVEAYDQYLTGDVWIYDIYDPEDQDCDESISSCGGFYGKDYCLQEAQAIVDHKAKKREEEAWKKVPIEAVYAV